MGFVWTQHRFSGGALALDIANTVILRFDASRRVDRFAEPAAVTGFAAAANRFCGEAQRFGAIAAPEPEAVAPLIRLREAADRHFRCVAIGDEQPDRLADLLDCVAAALRAEWQTKTPPQPLPTRGRGLVGGADVTKNRDVAVPLEGEIIPMGEARLSPSPLWGGVGAGSSPIHLSIPLLTATARSALSLAAGVPEGRLKICPNCEWLFLDKSRNRSRTWCDMAVCGNRAKAHRHYHRQKEDVR